MRREQRRRARNAAWTYVQSVLVSVGNITIMWAGIELMLDRLIHWYQARVGTVIRKKLPRHLSEKLAYVEKMEPDIRFSATQREELRAIRLELQKLSEGRHNLIHGLLHQTDYRSTEWAVHRLEVTRSGVTERTIHYSNADIQNYSNAVADVSHRMSHFFRQIMGW